MYYKPLLPNGQQVPLPWQIKIFYIHITWPLRDNPTPLVQFFGYATVSLGFLMCLLAYEGQIYFIIENFNDINLSIEALATCVLLNECMLRIFNMAATKKTFKKFLKEFFLTVYIDEETHPVTWKQIHRGLIPAKAYSYVYILAMISFQMLPLLQSGQDKRSLPYKLSPPYDLNPPALYGLTLVYVYWTGSAVTLFMIAEAFLLANFILHLNARYTILQEDIQQCSRTLLLKVPKSHLAREFRKKLFQMNERNCNLDRFSVLLNTVYNFRIFVMVGFSAVLLCVLAVQVSARGIPSVQKMGYIFWIVAQISELILFGTLGSTLIQTTDKMSSIYYLSNWEDVINRSTNIKENILLMKDLQILMSLHRNPKRLTGYTFFDFSFYSVIMVLRAAFSYYTFLRAIRR